MKEHKVKAIHLAAALVLGLSAAAPWAPAQQTRPATQPATQPAGARVLATVGDVPIRAGHVDYFLRRALAGARTPPGADQIAAARQRILERIIEGQLVSAYLKGLPCTDKELADHKAKLAAELKRYGDTLERFMRTRGLTDENLRTNVKRSRLREEAASKQKVDAFLKASPAAYFDGTKVRARHVLIGCPYYASKAVKDAAHKKLEAIAADVKAGKVKFEEAARKHSTCPSSAKGGDLGPFTFDRMVGPFSVAAFGMKVGDVSGIVETRFGFHLILVTDRTAGSGKAGPNAAQAATQILLARQHEQILSKAVAENPVTLAGT
jgi:hypothetical protein